ncbi:snurportin-1 [Diabrotica virgifera virgifera]|uniref:Snurportin-1 n=1 Tax=Diabrotica virgifera virgifera TaxID=50390 RepID=A0ABM5KWX0_DIAVI|nr:snurportin-1 [Diabrotica virgifera virgifera]
MESPPHKCSDNPHAQLYKCKERKQSQHERRIKFLEDLKEKRTKCTDENRQLCDTFFSKINAENSMDDSADQSTQISDTSLKEIENESSMNESAEIEETQCDESEEMDVETRKGYKKSIRFKLMLTEWFHEIPDDLEEDWIVKFCPEGKRMLLISMRKLTSFYNEKGKYVFKTRTKFPGGGNTNPRGTTVLDCIYNKYIKTFFILDCLYCNNIFTVPNEATFRFYWLKSKFDEKPEWSNCENSKYKFVLMDSFPAERALIQEKMFDVMKIRNKDVLYDGVVFYHKESEYTFGNTPLATWLHSFMLLEKLGIDIPEIYRKKIPTGYINAEHYIENRGMFGKHKWQERNEKKIKQLMEI